MNSRVLGLALGGLAILGGGLVWWNVRAMTSREQPVPSSPVARPSSASPSRRNHRRRRRGTSSLPSLPTAHFHRSQSSPSAPEALGTVRWAMRLRAALGRQWGGAAPPVWAVPDPRHSGTWWILAPVAHAGALWWARATAAHPLPTFQAVPTTLRLTNAQLAALPRVLQGALNQAYDLMRVRPWPVTTRLPSLTGQGVMNWQTAEANGTTAAPVGWGAFWNPAIPASSGFPGRPAGVDVVVEMPWHASHYAPTLASESMEALTTGRLLSGGTVSVSSDASASLAQQTAALPPTSVAAGISGG